MGFKRKRSRVEMSRAGRLQRGSMSATCRILDVSETGVRIETRLFVKSGDALKLLIEFDHGQLLVCMLQVVYVRAPRFGARITSISPEDQVLLSRLLDDQLQTNLARR
jgi:PilZ domain